jgi:hypothetical protein
MGANKCTRINKPFYPTTLLIACGTRSSCSQQVPSTLDWHSPPPHSVYKRFVLGVVALQRHTWYPFHCSQLLRAQRVSASSRPAVFWWCWPWTTVLPCTRARSFRLAHGNQQSAWENLGLVPNGIRPGRLASLRFWRPVQSCRCVLGAGTPIIICSKGRLPPLFCLVSARCGGQVYVQKRRNTDTVAGIRGVPNPSLAHL